MKDAIEFLKKIPLYNIKPGLERISYLSSLFNNPEKELKIIHVAGTNGKGSVSATISSILKEAGYKVGLYISPHLNKINERISINGNLISDLELDKILNEIYESLFDNLSIKFHSEPQEIEHPLFPSFFELLTEASFIYFKRKKVDFVVLEVGLGGRWDATNICTPYVSVITTISYDHCNFLGNDLISIASEKGGIIKENIPVVTGVTNPQIIFLYETICKEKKSKLFVIDREFKVKGESSKNFSYKSGKWNFENLETSLNGKHQILNSGVSIATLEILSNDYGVNIEPKAIYNGLKNVVWHGRCEIVKKNPLIILDGAHNVEGITALSNFLKEEIKYEKLHLIISIMSDKDYLTMLEILVPCADYIYVTSPHLNKRAISPEILKAKLKEIGKDSLLFFDSKLALQYALQEAKEKDCICITGSLYLVGEIRNHLI